MKFSIKGENNTGKTALALSFPKQLEYFDCDPGGFARALVTVPKTERDGIVYHAYPMPVTTIRANLGIDLSKSGMDRLRGVKELWYQFVDAFCDAIDDPNVSTLVIDTFSQLYSICIDAFLQEKQEAQESGGKLPTGQKYRENLIQIEYRNVNQRMHTLFDAVPDHKNLVVIHHMDDVWGEKLDAKGKVVDAVVGRDAKGWKKCGPAAADLADIVMQMEQQHIKKAGEPLKVVFVGTFKKSPPILMEQSLEFPTYTDIVSRMKLVS